MSNKNEQKRYIEPLEKVGIYSIKKLVENHVKQSIFDTPSNWREVEKEIKDTHYFEKAMNDRGVKGNQIVTHIFFNGGKIKLSDQAKEKYGEDVVRKAYDWFKSFIASFDPPHETKTAICGWIAENIFDVDAMAVENNWKYN